MKIADQIKQFARDQYIEPARRQGANSVRIPVGELHRKLRLSNRVPSVCTALRSRRFLEENRLLLTSQEGPSSGLSTTVAYTYSLLDKGAGPERPRSAFRQLRGIAKEVFRSLGGAEQFLRAERESLSESQEKSTGKR